MFHVALQLWGGIFYLLNKISFSFTERTTGNVKRVWRIKSWVVYLIGLPAWVIIFALERNWMAASVEAGGAAGMALGLMNALRGIEREPKWLDYIARICTAIGIIYSIYDFRGITTWNQVLELGIVIGFLLGTYFLAKQRPSGYRWLMLMNGSNAVLMGIEHYPWLFFQQILSLGFVIDAYFFSKEENKNLS